MANESPAFNIEVSAPATGAANGSATEPSASATELPAFTSATELSALGDKFRCLRRLSNHLVVSQLLQLNLQNHRLEAELLLNLGELDRRQIYREQATASAFEFCVSRLGYSEDVAFKRVGAARLMRCFPLVYNLLVVGRIHLTALMLLRPYLTLENHEEWLLLACEKSKRQVEKLVASRCPRPDVPTSIRQLRHTRQSPLAANPELAATDNEAVNCANERASAQTPRTTNQSALSAQAMPAQLPTAPAPTAPVSQAPASTRQPAATRVAPLSSKTYLVTFTASERLKQKMDRAAELLSHCIRPSDLPALMERALDQLLEREETRRYGARPTSDAQPVERAVRGNSTPTVRPLNPQPLKRAVRDNSTPTVRPLNLQPFELAGDVAHRSCQEVGFATGDAQDPDLSRAPALNLSRAPARAPALNLFLDFALAPTGQAGSNATSFAKAQQKGCAGQRDAMVNAKSRRCVPAAVRRAVFERDGGQCTFVDHQGRRCGQRHFLEFDHIEAYAIGGTETVTNLRLACAVHNGLEAERLFGRERVKSAIKHAKQGRAG